MNKQSQRKLAAEARRSLTPQQRMAFSEAICRRLLQLPELREAGTVLSYMALPDEADLSAVHEELRRRGVRLLFPISRAGGVLEAWEPRSWRSGPYGIREPDERDSRPASPEEIELVLAPCVAFDESCGRLGHGAGYYDRYLPRTSCPVIAAAFEAQRLDAVICDGYDRRMDAVVTEQRVYRHEKT